MSCLPETDLSIHLDDPQSPDTVDATGEVHRLNPGRSTRSRRPVPAGAGTVTELRPAPAVAPSPAVIDAVDVPVVADPVESVVAHEVSSYMSDEKADRHERVRVLLMEMVGTENAGRRRDLAARVVLEHQGVARSIAARYRGRGVERADLEQLAYLGLLKAVQRWEPGRSDDFLQFAVPTVAGEIKRYFRDHSFTVRPPRRIQELRAALSATDADSTNGTGHRRSEDELGAEFGVAPAVIREARQASELCHPRSLDAPTSTGQSLTQCWGCEDERLGQVEDRLAVSAMLTALTEREQAVVRMRFVEGLSQARIGEEIGVSQMQVSRLLRGIAGKLREQLAS